MEGKGWGVHLGPWPSDTGLQCKRADKGKPVEGKGGEPEHKPKAKGRAQWKPKSCNWADQVSGTSESQSQDNEEETDKDETPQMSSSKKRRARQKAFRTKAYKKDATPTFMYKGHKVPFAHRFCRKSPKEMRNNSGGMVNKWNNMYYSMKGLAQ